MGQKVHPNGIRLGISRPWNATWYANTNEFADNLHSDFQVRKFLTKELRNASVSRIVIDRPAKSVRVTIHTARPGVVIGKKGEDVEKLRKQVSKLTGSPAQINISEVRKPELDSQLVADNIAGQLERRVMFRRAMKRAVQNAIRLGAKGIKVELSGIVKAVYRCTHYVQTSTTRPQKRTPLTVSSVLRSGFSVVKFLVDFQLKKSQLLSAARTVSKERRYVTT